MNKLFEKISFWMPTNKNPLKKDLQYSVVSILPVSMIIISFFYNNPVQIVKGLWTIILANDVFATDYTQISSIGAGLFNSGIVTLINIYILRKFDLKLNGIIISALFLITGFAFVGKNIYNIWPFYIGGYIYAKTHKVDFKNVIVTSMYTTALAPIISVMAHTFAINVIAAVILSYSIGIFIGYVMPEVSSRMLMAHSGYNVYNTGFAAGFMAIVINSILNVFGERVSPKNIVNLNFDYGLLVMFVMYFLVLILIGYSHNNEDFSGYSKLISYSGRLITDYTRLCGFPITLVNMGFLGLISIAYIILMGGSINGPTIAALLTVVGFGALGKHPRNTISIMIGVAISSKMLSTDLSTTTIIISGLFGTTLAPIVGEYGFIYGLLIGPLHLALVANIGSLHAGLNLYNNGLSGGIIAMTVVPILDSFKVGERR